jgi:hypothetical protein
MTQNGEASMVIERLDVLSTLIEAHEHAHSAPTIDVKTRKTWSR